MRGRSLLAATALVVLASCVPARPSVWVFTAPWDARSDAALANGVAPDAMIVSGWIALDTLDAPPRLLFTDATRSDPRRRDRRLVLVTSYLGERFHPETVRRLAADPALRERVSDELAGLVREGGYRGAVLDLEALEPSDTAALVTVTAALSSAVRRAGGEVSIAVPALDTVAYAPRLLLPFVDHLVVMLYDLHWSGSDPGPITEPAWSRAALAWWVAAAGAGRVVAALPTYGYHWRPGAATEVVGWEEMQALVGGEGAPPIRDAASGVLRLRLADSSEAWLADGPLLAKLATDARALGVRTVALWRLGLEDPAAWAAIGVR